MDIDNSTPVPVSVKVNAGPEGEPRTAIFTAKATYAFSDGGAVEMEKAEPYPLFDEDQQTELGLLPTDALPRVDDVFEVMLLGKAYGPPGRPVLQTSVGLGVGSERRYLWVYGDRTWQGEGPGATISAPQPFMSMPLVWANAFGGKQQVLIDFESPVEVTDPVNPDGKGFDHPGQVRALQQVFKPPEGYPQYSPVRELPNLEDPRAPVTRWEDAPLPACWAPVPMHYGILLERLRRVRQREPDRPIYLGAPEIMHRAHPDWVIARPVREAPVELHGVRPGGPVRFVLPALRVLLDVRIGVHEEVLELMPRSLVLLPEAQRFYVVYRHFMQFTYRDDDTRAARVRLSAGWCGAA